MSLTLSAGCSAATELLSAGIMLPVVAVMYRFSSCAMTGAIIAAPTLIYSLAWDGGRRASRVSSI